MVARRIVTRPEIVPLATVGHHRGPRGDRGRCVHRRSDRQLADL